MNEKAFNLLHEPWIKVRLPDGQTQEASLINTFQRAHQLEGFSGELPTQDVAIMRLMLAVLFKVFAWVDPEGNEKPLYQETAPREAAMERWKQLWDKGAFPIDIIEAYLLEWEDRFWLFHEKHPFCQVALTQPLMDAHGEEINPSHKSPEYMIGDIWKGASKDRIFASRTDRSSIGYAEAARWLMHLNGFDAAPGGAPAKKGITIKGYGTSWLGKLGLIWVNGNSLFETLLLNLPFNSDEREAWKMERVQWEEEEVVDAEVLKQMEASFPSNPAALFSMRHRYVQLTKDENLEGVTGLWLWSGQLLDDTNAFIEPMTLWKKNKENERQPQLHQEARQVWRDFAAILTNNPKEDDKPGVIRWIAELKEKALLPYEVITMSTLGITYKNNTAVDSIFWDELQVNQDFFAKIDNTTGDAGWIGRVTKEISVTEKLVEELGFLMMQLEKATGFSEGSKADRSRLFERKNGAKEQAYFRLDEPFRRWLASIDPVKDMEEKEKICRKWRQVATGIVRELGKDLVLQAGNKAFVGRVEKVNMKGKEVEKHFSAPAAFNQFMYRISSLDTD